MHPAPTSWPRQGNGPASWTVFTCETILRRKRRTNRPGRQRFIGGAVKDEAGRPIAGALVAADLFLTDGRHAPLKLPGEPPFDWLLAKRTPRDISRSPTCRKAQINLHVKASGKAGARLMPEPSQPGGLFAAGDMAIQVLLAPEARIQRGLDRGHRISPCRPGAF